MKLNNIKRLIALLTVIYCCGISNAQQANTLYFMQGVSERSIYNPAFQSPYSFYLDLPVMPNLGLSIGNNSLVLNDIIFNKNNQTISFLHPDAMGKRTDFFNALHNTTRINADFSLNLLGFGFRKNKNYFSFDISLKEQTAMYLPKDLFKLVLYGTDEESKFDLSKLGLDASVYTEIALGYSRQLNEKWTVGGKLKFLSGLANISTDIKNLDMNLGINKWHLNGSGTLNASMPKAALNREKVFIPDPNDPNRQIIDFDNLGDAFNDDIEVGDLKASDFFKNMGFALDLGVTYKVLPQLQLSAAVTDLGYIRWNNDPINAGISKDYTFDGIEYIVGDTWNDGIKDQLENEGDKLKGVFSNNNLGSGKGKSYKTSLSTRFNIGAEYGLLNDKIGIGLLSSTLYAHKALFPDLTASVNFRPCNWFQPTVSYSVLDGGFKTLGAGVQIKLGMFNMYLAVDKIPVGSKPLNKQYVPQHMNGTNVYAGMTWVFGDSRSWKNKDSDRDGVKNKKDRCPDTPIGWLVDTRGCPVDADGDGIPDNLDECPETPTGVIVDAKGCPLDSDGDGVPDYLDKCADTPADVAVDEHGCPIDADGDGVPDYLDNCPNTPVEAYATIDIYGCPKDSDGDGVPDYLDKCPNTPAEAYATIDEYGCPKDSDGDGIPDYLDRCPTVPGTVANNGCPELQEKERAIFEKALHGIQFATGKDIISKASYPILDAIVMIMKENPTYFLDIYGHTDNVGKQESNQILSTKRAESVRNYLVKEGVETDRLRAQGFGDTQPIVPNTTAANKAQNRRVEFIVKYEKEIDN